MAKLNAELGRAQQMVDVHMAEQNKPLLDKVTEVRQLSDALGLSPDKDATSPTELGMQGPLYERLLMGLISNADKLLPQLTGLIKKDGGQGQEAQAAQEQQAVAMQQQQQQNRRALPPRRPRRMMFADPEAAPVREYDHIEAPKLPTEQEREAMPATAYSVGAPVPYMPPQQQQQQSRQPPPQQPQQPQQPQPTQPRQYVQQSLPQQQPQQLPRITDSAPAPQAQKALRQRQPAQKPESLAQPVSPGEAVQPMSQFEWIGLPPEQLINFLGFLDKSCVEAKPPTEVAAELVQAYGKDLIQAIVASLDFDRLIASIRTDPATAEQSVLATGKGKRFLVDVWAQLREQSKSDETLETAPGEAVPIPDAN
ncbi:MAG: hypothetical protein ACYTEQ_05290 [Planctomycetota bacterium]